MSRLLASLHKEVIMTKYRHLLGLYLTNLEIKVMSVLTDERLDQATPDQPVKCLDIILKAEKRIERKKSSKPKGVIGILEKNSRLPLFSKGDFK